MKSPAKFTLREYEYVKARIEGVSDRDLMAVMEMKQAELDTLKDKFSPEFITAERERHLKSENAGRDFMTCTRYLYQFESDQEKRQPCPPLEKKCEKGQEIIDLPPYQGFQLVQKDLSGLIDTRRSIRRYSTEAMSREELSWLLWSTQGVREKKKVNTLRTVPSAGARHALETYLVIMNVEGLKPGLYRYLSLEHKLVLLRDGEAVREGLVEACWDQKFIGNAAVTFIWTAVPYRMSWRYGQRGYRYLLLDAGHVCQNLYLAGEAAGTGVCAVAAFVDEIFSDFLEIDGEDEFVIYAAVAGKREQ